MSRTTKWEVGPTYTYRASCDDHWVIDDGPDAVTQLLAVGRDREAAIAGLRSASSTNIPTPATPYGGPSMEPLDQFAMLGPILGGVVGGIRPEDLGRPTPCAQFTVEGVLRHMIEGATGFAAAFRGEAAEAPDTSDVLAGFGVALGGLGEAVNSPGALDRTIDAPFGALPGDVFARFVVLDGLLHGWDMAIATNQPYDPPVELIADVEAFAAATLDPLRDGTTFAAATVAPAGSTPMEQLAALTGRTVPAHN